MEKSCRVVLATEKNPMDTALSTLLKHLAVNKKVTGFEIYQNI